MIRQGDILLVPDTAPENYRHMQADADYVVVGYGEATGHTHVLERATWVVAPETTEEHLRLFAMGEMFDVPFFVVVESDAALTHQEHAPITVPPGTWRVIRQREYAPEAIRSVVD